MAKQRSDADTENQHRDDGGWKVVSQKQREKSTGRYIAMEGYNEGIVWKEAWKASGHNPDADLEESQIHYLYLDDDASDEHPRERVHVFGDVTIRIERPHASAIPLVVALGDRQSLVPLLKRSALSDLVHVAAMSSPKPNLDVLISETVLDAKTALDLLDNPREPNQALLDILELN